jgi:muramoyltetrapeptide carboxypeptidase
MKQILPPRLRPGDLIGVISPASPPHDSARIARGIDYLLSRGYRVRIGNGVGLRSGYFAGSDRVRLQDVHDMFEDEHVHAIFCTRGGYGSARLLQEMDYDLVQAHPKILVGFSDITALTMGLLARSGLISFAGPMVAAELADDIPSLVETALWDMLSRPAMQRELELGSAARTMRAGRAEGPLVGGNLSVLCSLIGSSWLPSFDGAILFIEDIGERVYRIDRMLLQLKYAGILDRLAGIALGSFTAIPESAADRALDEVFEEYFLPLNIPVLHGLPFGHIREKITLPVGARVRLDAGKCTLTVIQPVVA